MAFGAESDTATAAAAAAAAGTIPSMYYYKNIRLACFTTSYSQSYRVGRWGCYSLSWPSFTGYT